MRALFLLQKIPYISTVIQHRLHDQELGTDTRQGHRARGIK